MRLKIFVYNESTQNYAYTITPLMNTFRVNSIIFLNKITRYTIALLQSVLIYTNEVEKNFYDIPGFPAGRVYNVYYICYIITSIYNQQKKQAINCYHLC